ncbi:MAG: GNAT family N-acetyltransferase [Bacteroidetes bacterium]|nr:MAG: GNAT family N-acetyltransferase [Bacteroidota bacterium]
MIVQNYYNAYTKVTPGEKKAIADFLLKNLEGSTPASRESVFEAIEYAVKDRPSFGGFLLTISDDNEMLGAMIVNETGLEHNPKNQVVFFAIEEKHRQNGVASKLVRRAIELTKGNLSLRLNPDNPAIEKLKSLGFQPQFVELRLPN